MADALTIANYCRLHAPPLRRKASPAVRHRRALLRRLADMQGQLTQEKNRASVPGQLPAVRESQENSFTFLEAEIVRLRPLIKEHIDRTPARKADQKLLVSIHGIGEATAQLLLAVLPAVKQFGSAEQVATWAGLCPQEHRSGTGVRKRTRLSKAGNGHVRKAVYFPAIAAVKHNPSVRALYQRLRDAGKSGSPRNAWVMAALWARRCASC